MRLLLPSLIIVIYLFASLIRPLNIKWHGKIFLSGLLIAVGLKYIFYQVVGGSFFRPELPVFVLVAAEALYGSLIFLFVLALCKDLLALVLTFGRCAGASLSLPGTPGHRATLLLVTALLCGSWGTYQAVRVPDVRSIEVKIEGLPKALDGFSIVQLSDIHIGPFFKSTWLSKVIRKTNALSPDMVVITGDLIDGLPHELREEVRPLAELSARYGVFGVAGNHEYYYDAPGWFPIFESYGVDILHNEHRVLPGGLILGGVNDRTAARFGQACPDVTATFADAPTGTRILLSHQPYLEGKLPVAGVALQLSGHTHGGSLFFLAPLIAHYNGGFVRGLYDTDDGQLYVSPGTGLWSGFSCRFGEPSEITNLILRMK